MNTESIGVIGLWSEVGSEAYHTVSKLKGQTGGGEFTGDDHS